MGHTGGNGLAAGKLVMVILGHGAYYSGIAQGVLAYRRTRPAWSVLLNYWSFAHPPRLAAAVRPDGVIIDLTDRGWFHALRRSRVPTVNVGNSITCPECPRVGVDEAVAGRLAAEHLLARGLRHFAFFGSGDNAFSREREAAFTAAVGARGHAVATLSAATDVNERSVERERRWVASLPKPVGVFVASDFTGLVLSEACRTAGARVPEDVAIIGMDNDPVVCGLCAPPLSSVDNPAERIGARAAALLDELMAGRPAPPGPVLVAPARVQTRQSTDVVAVGDPDVAHAVRFIRDHAHRPVEVADVLRAVPVSRRWLERQFRRHLGRTPLREIRRTRIDRVKDVLLGTDLTLAQVARTCGFGTTANLAVAFRKETGTTMAAFRRANRVG